MAGDDNDTSAAPELSEQDRRENKERRRRERRERRARRQRQRQTDMLHQLDGHMYEGGCHGYVMDLPDILNSHLPPPPYTTLPGRGHGALPGPPPPPPASSRHRSSSSWRAAFPGFNRNR